MKSNFLRKSALFCIAMTFLAVGQAYARDTSSPACKKLDALAPPKGGKTPEACYNEAKAYLVAHKIKVMTGSYEAYFALSEDDGSQRFCRRFLQTLVKATEDNYLPEVVGLFGNDRAFSLDRSYYSYFMCADYSHPHAKASVEKNPTASASAQAVQ